ncbi:hypothetical protein G6F37_008186 [Rhizopus arrhizus]|nr:hypothetical protein G6F38_007810 [Rhizopus arrhizus]KAG1155822.1 hypothetical protein G6F37_008186 [Rhizopus arrhizus]
MGGCCCKERYKEDIDFTSEPNLSHFDLQNLIGQGVFGKVRIVRHKKTGRRFALKYVNKSICIKQKAINNIITERKILERIHHSLITNLHYAFQDDDTLFFVLDPILGGDLRFHLKQHQSFPECQVRHYVACIALSLNYLHSKRIAHRDIKPENILLDQQNYAYLSDFNIAFQFSPQQPLVWSRSGTVAYMAPDVLSKRGYSTSVDWWSLGIVAFELLFGTLLVKSPHQRLGCHGFEKFKSHPWFKGLDWDKLEKKQLPSPCLLDVSQ